MTSHQAPLLALATGVLVASTLVAAPAFAAPSPSKPGGPEHFPVSVQTTVPAGGSSMITTPTLGKDVDTLKVKIKPVGDATAEEDAVYDQFLSTIGNLSKGKRLLVCVMMYQFISAPSDLYGEPADVNSAALTISGSVLIACLQMAGLLQSGRPAPPLPAARGVVPPAALAGRGCGQARPSLPAALEQTADGYTLHAEGTVKKAGKQKYRVSCRAQGNTVSYTIRSTKKGVPLRRALGKKISVGIQSPPGAGTSVPVKVTFATP